MEAKKNILNNIELRSESVQDILTHPPHWLVRWGTIFIFFLLLLILVMSWFIKYPEFVPSTIIISTGNPPERHEARLNTRIQHIFVKDHQEVKTKQNLMVLESTANYQDVVELHQLIDSLGSSNLSSFPIQKTSQFKLGDVQSDYNAFAKAVTDEKLYQNLQPYVPENIATDQTIRETKGRIISLEQQKNLEHSKYLLSQKDFDRDQILFNQGVISASDLDQERIKLLQAKQLYDNIDLSISQAKESIVGLQKTKSRTSINAQKDQVNFSSQTIQLLEQLRKSLNGWEQDYLVTSSVNGEVSFQQYLSENQFVKAGDVLLTVLPNEKKALIGRLLVPSMNFGKVKIGQKVLIKLDNYPYQEFGIIEGRVRNISIVADKDGNYYVDVLLPHGLKTSYNKTLIFDKELKGSAEIVTKDLRLIERLFYQIRNLFKYQN